VEVIACHNAQPCGVFQKLVGVHHVFMGCVVIRQDTVYKQRERIQYRENYLHIRIIQDSHSDKAGQIESSFSSTVGVCIHDLSIAISQSAPIILALTNLGDRNNVLTRDIMSLEHSLQDYPQ
jgi:hypothetical protein